MSLVCVAQNDEVTHPDFVPTSLINKRGGDEIPVSYWFVEKGEGPAFVRTAP